MTVPTQLWRRAPLALALLTITIAAGAGRLAPPRHPSPLQSLATSAHATSTSTSTTTTTVPATTTTAAPAPEPEPEVAALPEEAAPLTQARAVKATPQPAPAPEPQSAPAPAPTPAPRPPQAGTESETAQFFSLLNQYRAEHGLPALVRVSDAMAKAKQHSDDMAASQQMYHSSSMSSGLDHYDHIGENIAMGGSVGRIEYAFESSAGHSRNMLSPNFNQVGIGVSRGDDGLLYVTEVFIGR